MHPITHGLIGWATAHLRALSPRGRAWVALCGLLPDLDGVGLPIDLFNRLRGVSTDYWGAWHHELGHNLGVALGLGLIGALAHPGERRRVGLLAVLSVHLHLLGDLVGARGPDGDPWPIPYLRPFADLPRLTWSGQWELNAWPNLVLTLLLLAWTFAAAWRTGTSPLCYLSKKADAAFVAALRARWSPSPTLPGGPPSGSMGP